jgi:gamma-butyrobetaine dioxygenase
MPSVNLLHCLVQSKSHGGKNLITDGFYVAELMRRDFPEHFETLSTVCVNWCDLGNEMGKRYHYVLRKPVIW